MKDIMTKLEKAVKSAAGTEYEVNFCETRKNNGVMLKSVSIRRPGRNAMPKMHIDGMLEMIASGKMEINEAAGLLIKACRKNEQEVEKFERITRGLSKEKILGCVMGQMINKAANARMFLEAPHKTVLDLALVYRVMLQESEYGMATFLVSHALCDRYGISLEELDSAASSNMDREGFVAHAMESILAEMDLLADKTLVDACPMLVITNRRRLYGAAVMDYPEYFENLSEKTGGDLYILPASIHEVIAVPEKGMEPDELQQMVMEINASELDKEEFLSDNVYRYSRKTGEITIV